MNDSFTHIDDRGEARMVDVGDKAVTRREARAVANITTSAQTISALRDNAVPKGNVFATARIAGIMAAKQTSALIPMAHPLALSHVDVEITIESDVTMRVAASARCEGRTGVEIEAMVACSVAALTIYDMCKSFDRGMVITDIRLEEKHGGKTGSWTRSPAT